MSESIRKVFFLKVPGAEEAFAAELTGHLPSAGVDYEFMEVSEGHYDGILDRLEAGVLPIVLKAPR